MCMTLIAGKGATSNGRVLVGHNEDDYVFYSVNHGYVPRCKWSEDAMLPAEKGCIQLHQSKETYGYYWTQVRKPDGGMATADSFINENGVVIVSNSSCGSREYDESAVHPDFGICYELRRTVAERAKTARHGLEIAIELIKTCGYNSPGRIYTIADADEAFMLQIVYGHYYMAARVPDDCIAVMPNHYTFHTLTDVPEMYYPADIITHAIERGFYVPKTEGDYSDFDFAAAYQNISHYRSPVNTLRQKYGTGLLLGYDFDAEKAGYPFCVKAERKIDASDFMRVLSYHYEGTESDIRYGNGQSPHFFTGVRRICTGSTLESAIYEFERKPWQTTVWTAFGRPCQVPYIPIHPLCGSVSTVDAMENPIKEAATHHEYRSFALTRKNTGYQRFTDFQNAAEFVYAREYDTLQSLKHGLYDEFVYDNRGNIDYADTLSETESREFLHTRDEKAAKYVLNVLSSVSSELFDKLIVEPASFEKTSKQFTVSFTSPEPLQEDSLIMWFGRSRFENGSAKAISGSLSLIGGTYSCAFQFEDAPFEIAGPGDYEFFISGCSNDGTPYVGMSIVHIL